MSNNLQKMGEDNPETKKSGIDWADPPKFCPRCGGQNITITMVNGKIRNE